MVCSPNSSPPRHHVPAAMICIPDEHLQHVYPVELIEQIKDATRLLAPPLAPRAFREAKESLAEVEVVFTGWGMPRLDDAVLQNAPKLRAVFYAAGATDYLITDASVARGITVCSAIEFNAIPVADFTVGQIFYGLKCGWQHVLAGRRTHHWKKIPQTPGAYRTTVGLVSLGAVGREIARRLRSSDLRVVAYDPFVPEAQAHELGVELIDLDAVFREPDVVSVHTPLIPETRGMIGEPLFRSLKPHATLINTSRGGVLDQTALVQVLGDRPDVIAVLDVTDPEPPQPDDPLWALDNAVITPHIAGSMGSECHRMTEAMIEDFRRWMNGELLQHEVRKPPAG